MSQKRFQEAVALVNEAFQMDNPPPALVEKAKEILNKLKKHSKTH